MSWKKVKNLFWQSGDGEAPAPAGADPENLSDDEFAAFLAADEFSVAANVSEPVDPTSVRFVNAQGEPISIDFQAQYDAAGIPNTDEVEQLEKFLGGLDNTLPHAAKLAAAQAFLGAIGKNKQDVLVDAERKIRRVHGIVQSKTQQVTAEVTSEQEQIAALEQQIERHRQRIQALQGELDGVKRACLLEESRLQAARVFFGHAQLTQAPPGQVPQG